MSSPNLTLVVQTISVTWTKEARGEPLATPRNRVPEVVALPTQPTLPRKPKVATPQSQYVLHTTEWSESNEFRQPLSDKIETVEFSGEASNQKLKFILEDDDTLTVVFTGVYSHKSGRTVLMRYTSLGAPARNVPIVPLTLKTGEWGQLRYNGRFSWNTAWKYEKWVFNIGLFEGQVASDCFKDSPTKSFSSIADLW